METTQFINLSREKIEKNPRLRLSDITRSELDQPDCVIDIHAHIFDKKCLTVAYILLRLLKSKILEGIGLEAFAEEGLLNKNESQVYDYLETSKKDDELDWEKLENELAIIEETYETVELFGFDLKEAFKVLKMKSMLEVFDNYRDHFSLLQLPEFENRPFVTGVLLMDLETGWDIKPKTKLFQQLTEIKQVMRKRPILPFFPLDPRRAGHSNPKENLYDLFLDAFGDPETPFFGVKCYPSLGYLPEDIRLDPIFEICAEKNIPVLTHCGGEIVSTFKKSIPVQKASGEIEFVIPGDTRVERARYLNDPVHWAPVLEKHKNLKLDFGHFGGDTNWEDHGTVGKNARINKIIDMMKNPDWKVFADFSFNVVEKELFDAFTKSLEVNPDIAGKVMFGTDYWVVLPAGDLLKMQKEFLVRLQDHQTSLLHSAPLNYLFQ